MVSTLFHVRCFFVNFIIVEYPPVILISFAVNQISWPCTRVCDIGRAIKVSFDAIAF
jgi:hypothetical protein